MKRLVWTKKNTVLLVIGLILLVVGYAMMSAGDMTLSPILLCLAYLVFFPMAIMSGMKPKEDPDSADTSGQ